MSPRTTTAPRRDRNRGGLGGAILTLIVMVVFFASIPAETSNAVPIDMTGRYAQTEPMQKVPDFLGIEYLDCDVLASR